MFGNYTYIVWLIGCIGVPLLLLLGWRRQIWPQRSTLAWVLLGEALTPMQMIGGLVVLV